ncbi:MAG: ferrous iron transport protein B [Candidatus Zixiibacteriota bacterium]
MGMTSDINSGRRTRLIAICGNPNCGKTTIFNAMTGLNQKVGNYPGVTVERVSGRFFSSKRNEQLTLIDIPGTYSLAAFSPDEYIASSAMFGSIDGESRPDAIICVIDATQLERGLYLLFQVMQIGCPVVVAVNMIDIARRRGISIDFDLLSRELGSVPVVGVVGNKGTGIDRLKEVTSNVAGVSQTSIDNLYSLELRARAQQLIDHSPNGSRNPAEYIRIMLDENGPAEESFLKEASTEAVRILQEGRQKLLEQNRSLSESETGPLMSRAHEIHGRVISTTPTQRGSRTEMLDKFLLHPIGGPLALILIMTAVFQSIFSWAVPFMNVIDSAFSALATVIESSMAEGPLRSLLTDGIIGGVGSVMVFVPQIAILFAFIVLLEDSGYMPRAAFLVDRSFRWCGLSGKSFIPLLSSFACAVPGIMSTRTIEDKKLRLLTILVAPLMTCSARLPVYAIMIAAFIPYKVYLGMFNLQGLVLAGMYLLGVLAAVVVALVFSKVAFKTERATFLMELPSYKLPNVRSVATRVINRLREFVVRAGTVILAITVVIWALSYYPRTEQPLSPNDEMGIVTSEVPAASGSADHRAGHQLLNSYLGRIGRSVQPLFEPLGWDWKITVSVLASFPAREVVIATLGTIYNLGDDVDNKTTSLVEKMRQERWERGPKAGQPVFTAPVALSIMVFFALCAQCGATLVMIRNETRSWRYPVFVFCYMTLLAYLAGASTYQLLSRVGL